VTRHGAVKGNLRRRPAFGAWARGVLERAAAAGEGGGAALPSEAELEAHCGEARRARVARQLFALDALAATVWPVIETAMLLDRLLFLLQTPAGPAGPVHVALEPLFDPLESPRNFVIVATRGRCK
jgi:hypothetical protein